ncbi:hypothetical protein [Paraliobacillus sp. JSM ZJ581]|uniref:hypothetical protein n=1 Tax=Paraliobacillus sp. JSM ZJ581 TaxID=3342118 RepID=UPI0035A8A18E
MIKHKEGISTHLLRVWINGDEAIVLQSYDMESNTATIGKLSKTQLENLQTIIE